jgi:hypothetical protein
VSRPSFVLVPGAIALGLPEVFDFGLCEVPFLLPLVFDARLAEAVFLGTSTSGASRWAMTHIVQLNMVSVVGIKDGIGSCTASLLLQVRTSGGVCPDTGRELSS